MSTVRVLVGTRKGAFILTADGKREHWEVSGPFFAGWEIYHLKGSLADRNGCMRRSPVAGSAKLSSVLMMAARPGRRSVMSLPIREFPGPTSGTMARSIPGNSRVSGI